MTTHGFTILDDGAPAEVAAHISGTNVRLAPDALRDAHVGEVRLDIGFSPDGGVVFHLGALPKMEAQRTRLR